MSNLPINFVYKGAPMSFLFGGQSLFQQKYNLEPVVFSKNRIDFPNIYVAMESDDNVTKIFIPFAMFAEGLNVLSMEICRFQCEPSEKAQYQSVIRFLGQSVEHRIQIHMGQKSLNILEFLFKRFPERHQVIEKFCHQKYRLLQPHPRRFSNCITPWIQYMLYYCGAVQYYATKGLAVRTIAAKVCFLFSKNTRLFVSSLFTIFRTLAI